MGDFQKENKKKQERYDELFSVEGSKEKAFDRIAHEFFFGNFGRMSKTDLDVLMFDIYIEQILNTKGDENPSEYSDYKLSKDLGLTQSKISSLKVKKQLQYPRDYDWRKAFSRVSKNARYEQEKIKLQIPDINVYYEVKNAIEEAGGYVEVSLTSKLLQVSPEYFLDLLVAISEDETRKELRKQLRNEIRKHDKDHKYLDAEPFGKQLLKMAKESALGVVNATANAMIGNVIGSGTSLAIMIKNVCSAFMNE